MTKKFSMKKLVAGVLATAMVVTALPVSGGVARTAKAADTTATATTVSVNRAYNPNNGEHLLTIDPAEYKATVTAGYTGEGEKWVAPVSSKTPVYRVYNPNSGEHLLVPQGEAEGLAKIGWSNEGIKMYSDDNKGVEIYRVYNPNAQDAGGHLYTSKEEATGLVALGWKWDNEGKPVIYGVKEEVKVVAKITDAKQITSDSIDIAFDQDASKLVSKDDIRVEAADGTLSIPVNKIEFSKTGTTATVTLSTALTDKTSYNVVYLKDTTDESKANFVASVGKVAKVVVKTTSAEQNVKTPIEFELRDANNVDVTSTVNESNVIVSVDGTYASAETSKAFSANVTLGNVDDEVEVTVTYNENGATQTDDIKGTGKIVCVSPKATTGTPVFAQTNITNTKSLAAKFYRGLKSTSVSVAEDGTVNNIYFYAADKNGNAISYDSYEVESSNDDIVSVSNPDKSSGKYTQITIAGNKVGSANINIKAEKNGVATPYMIPVSVVKSQEASNVTVTVDRSTISNAYDTDYKGTITVKVTDAAGNASTDYTSVEIAEGTDEDYSAAKYLNTAAKKALGAEANGFQVEDKIASDVSKTTTTFTAYGAKAATNYPIKVVLTKNDGKTVERKVNISVKALPDDAYDHKGKGVKVTYGIELGTNTLDSAYKNGTTFATTARVTASVNNIFAGYVRTGADGHSTIIGTTLGTMDAAHGEGYIKTPDNKFVKIEEKDTTHTGYSFVIADPLTAARAIEAKKPTGSASHKGLTFTVSDVPATGKASKLNNLKVTVTNNDTNADAIAYAGGTLTVKVKSSVDITSASAGDVKTEVEAALTNADLSDIDETLDNVSFTVDGTYNNASAAADATTIKDGVDGSAEVAMDVTEDEGVFTLNWFDDATNAEVAALIGTDDADTKGLFTATAIDELPDGATEGYMPGADGTEPDAWLVVNREYEISDVALGAKFGSLYAKGGNLFDLSGKAPTPVKNDENKIEFTTVDLTVDNPGWVVGDSTKTVDFARNGSYTVFFTYINAKGEDKTATNSLTVKNSFYIPKVTVTSRKVDSLDSDGIKEVLETSVDMNNDDGLNTSVVEAALDGKQTEPKTGYLFNAATDNDGKMTVKYVVVDEDGVFFYVPINSTFRTE